MKFLFDVCVVWCDVVIGGIVFVILFFGGKKLFVLYFVYVGIVSVFGVVGLFVVLLMWLYFFVIVLLFGVEFVVVCGDVYWLVVNLVLVVVV